MAETDWTAKLRAVLALEFIGENYWAYRRASDRAIREGRFYGPLDHTMEHAYLRPGPIHRSKPWVARITGRDAQYGLARTFVDGQIDYSRANSTGSRGVWLYFALPPGVYEVYEHQSWKHARRYFARVDGASVTEISAQEVESWLANHTNADSASAS